MMVLLLTAVLARADAAYLLEEPYGRFGSMNPTGHAAVYLSNVCADTPTHLRLCHPGETGVVISRYHRIEGLDWLAIPLVPYLYAVDEMADIPSAADAETVAALRDAYRRTHLQDYAPNGEDGSMPAGDWTQLVGSAYDRKLYGFEIETTPEQDARLVEWLNRSNNRTQYSLFLRNCADFAAAVMNFYEPHMVRRNYLLDLGVTTPKYVARSIVKHARKHPRTELSAFYITQIPGTLPRSRPADGIAEALVRSKKYVLPLALLSPVTTGTLAGMYVAEGRFRPERYAESFDLSRAVEMQAAPGESSPRGAAHGGGSGLSGERMHFTTAEP
ncbi:MAG: hypothetical protein P4M01_11335 [Acidobacteriota bacterium]|nr:hypothetical protein [Acidobacteriota bacterium]